MASSPRQASFTTQAQPKWRNVMEQYAQEADEVELPIVVPEPVVPIEEDEVILPIGDDKPTPVSDDDDTPSNDDDDDEYDDDDEEEELKS